MSFPFPWFIVASDGKVIRTLHPPAFATLEREMIEKILAYHIHQLPASPVREPPAAVTNLMTQGEIARESGYTGDPCGNCGAFKLRRNGTCEVCDACGTTTGCS